MDQYETWHAGRPRPGHTVLDKNPAPPPPKGHSPRQISAHACCGQTAGWIKMQLGTIVGLGSGNTVLHGDPAPPKRGTVRNIIIGPCLLWPYGRPSVLLLNTCTHYFAGVSMGAIGLHNVNNNDNRFRSGSENSYVLQKRRPESKRQAIAEVPTF